VTVLKKGILLLNMGGPNSIDEVELFLRHMFADPYILPMNRYMRKFMGNIIIKKRLHEAQENYRQIGGKSPLTEISEALSQKLEQRLGLPVRPAMRYVPPFALDALRIYQQMGIEEIVLFPMYPQYSTTTTRSSVEDVEAQCEVLGYRPALTVIEPYHSDPAYVALQVAGIMEALGSEEASDYDLLLSAHGLPMRIIEAGDPYRQQIELNAAAIKRALAEQGVDFRSIRLVYQSKVGSGEWLEPNLIDVLRKPQHLKVLIYPLAFTIDNSETIFELDIEHREIADKIGYEAYRVAKCPNESDAFVECIVAQISAV
jgi:ferrochelatase